MIDNPLSKKTLPIGFTANKASAFRNNTTGEWVPIVFCFFLSILFFFLFTSTDNKITVCGSYLLLRHWSKKKTKTKKRTELFINAINSYDDDNDDDDENGFAFFMGGWIL